MEKKQFIDFMNSWMALNKSAIMHLNTLPIATKKKIMGAGLLPSNVVLDNIRGMAENIIEIKNFYSSFNLDNGYYYCFVNDGNNNYQVFVLDEDRIVLYSLDGNCSVTFVDNNNNLVQLNETIRRAFLVPIK